MAMHQNMAAMLACPESVDMDFEPMGIPIITLWNPWAEPEYHFYPDPLSWGDMLENYPLKT